MLPGDNRDHARKSPGGIIPPGLLFVLPHNTLVLFR